MAADVTSITNTISYGFSDAGDHTIHVDLQMSTDHLTIRVEDDGCPFDLTKAPLPDVTAPIDERPVGGLGVLLVRSLMDDLTYSRRGGRNVLLMTKHAPATQGTKHA